MQTKQLHYISGLTLAVFIALHLFNHFCSIFGIPAHIELMNALRHFYRNAFIETIILCAVFVQIISGLLLFRAKRKTAVTAFEKLHIWTGLYLAIFLIVHLTAVFTGRLYLHLDTNFYFGVAGLNTFPFSLFFVPYYSLAIIAIFGHIASVHNNKMKTSVFGISPVGQSKIIFGIGFFLTIAIFYGLTNHFNGVAIPAAYNKLIGK